MTYTLELSEKISKKFYKLEKKGKAQLEAVNKKLKQILEDPYRFKPLRGDMKGGRRVHIEKSFVLTYEINENCKKVRLLDYDHHDKIYL